MTSQLRRFFQASQAVHGADDITTLPIQTQVNSRGVCGPQVVTLIYYIAPECPTLFNQLCEGQALCDFDGDLWNMLV